MPSANLIGKMWVSLRHYVTYAYRWPFVVQTNHRLESALKSRLVIGNPAMDFGDLWNSLYSGISSIGGRKKQQLSTKFLKGIKQRLILRD